MKKQLIFGMIMSLAMTGLFGGVSLAADIPAAKPVTAEAPVKPVAPVKKKHKKHHKKHKAAVKKTEAAAPAGAVK